MGFLVEEENKRTPTPINEGLGSVGAEEGACAGVVRIYFSVECVKQCIIRPSGAGSLAHQVDDHG